MVLLLTRTFEFHNKRMKPVYDRDEEVKTDWFIIGVLIIFIVCTVFYILTV